MIVLNVDNQSIVGDENVAEQFNIYFKNIENNSITIQVYR